ncbi:MAG TPA: serine/threonine-protein kinase, partial [Candidatus Didemnitutus sp.]|nr:serine/threonine-protein kinase [Candidatus Didemnitutus sp.]
MPDPTSGADNSAIPAVPGALPPEVPAQIVAKTAHKLVGGERWQGYMIDRPVTNGGGNLFYAKTVASSETVHIRATRITESVEWRRGAWERIRELPMAAQVKIIGCIEAQEEEGWRYEVMNAPPPTSLREWMACNKANKAVVDDLLQQLSLVIGALHAQGVVHLNLRPDTIYVDDSRDDAMGIVLGGIEEATLYTQPMLVLTDFDPLYAPPEAAGKKTHPPGTGLCAWDWWSVGRIVQEFLLGRHVMHIVVGSGPAPATNAELRARAELLLLEQEPPGLRAGAVEAMGPLMPSLKSLMRGLLTAPRDARWGAENIRRWLAGETVPNHYDLPREARLFVWKGRGMPLGEAIDFFTREENWADGEENLFNPEKPETLSFFLSSVPDHAGDWTSLQSIFEVALLPAWGSVSVEVRRNIIAAAAWLTLAHRLEQRVPLRVLGQTIDIAGLAALLDDSRNENGAALVQALMGELCLKLISPLDPAAARMLSRLGKVSNEALQRAEANVWLDRADRAGQARVLRLSLDPESALASRVARLRSNYASCRDPELARLLNSKELPTWASIILVYTAEDPIGFGYITHTDWNRQQVQGLQARSQRLATALFWIRARQALAAGRPVTSTWPVFVTSWLAVVVAGMIFLDDDLTTIAVAVGLLGLRLAISWRVGKWARQVDPEGKPWNWRNGPRHCTLEMARCFPDGKISPRAQIEQQLRQIDSEAVALQASGFRPAYASVPLLGDLWGGLMVGGLAFAFLTVYSAATWPGREHGRNAWLPKGLQSGTARDNSTADASGPAGNAAANALEGLSPEMMQKVAKGEYEIIDDGFGRRLRGPLTKWESFAPASVQALPVLTRQASTPLQQAYAKVSAELLLSPYGHNAVNVFLAVRVPTAQGFSLMVFNGRDRRLEGTQAFSLGQSLSEHTWY